MALPILDGNQSATTLSTILSSGQHITAHTVVSLGTQAITDIVNATSAGLTNTQLRASAVTVGGTVTVGNSVTISSLPAISGTVTANIGLNVAQSLIGGVSETNPPAAVRVGWCGEENFNGVGVDNGGLPLPIQIYMGASSTDNVTTANPLPISGTVNAALTNENDFVVIGEEIAQGINNQGTIPISGTVTANLSAIYAGEAPFSQSDYPMMAVGGLLNGFDEIRPIRIDLNTGGQIVAGTVTVGETPTSGTATLTNDTRYEINTEGFGHIALEIVSTGAAWGANGVVAQAYNGTAPGNADIFAPAGIRYRHSTDGATLNQALNNFYYNLNIAPNVGNAYGTSFIRIDGNTVTTLGLPSTGTRYFLFDLTTSRFALRPNFTAGTAQVKYRLYKGKHPFFSARNVIVRGENSDGKINVAVPDAITANVVYAIQDGDGSTFGVDRDFPISGTVSISNRPDQGASGQGTVSSFTSTSSAVLRSQNSTRKLLTVFNEGAGNLFVLLGGGTASTTNYSLRLSAGDFYELDKYTGEVNAIFGSAGTARVTEIT